MNEEDFNKNKWKPNYKHKQKLSKKKQNKKNYKQKNIKFNNSNKMVNTLMLIDKNKP